MAPGSARTVRDNTLASAAVQTYLHDGSLLSERIVIDPEAVLECFRISESGPALAGPVPTPPMYLRR